MQLEAGVRARPLVEARDDLGCERRPCLSDRGEKSRPSGALSWSWKR